MLQNIVISRTKGEFVKCDTCVGYSNLLQTERDPFKRADLKLKRRIHMYKMWIERKYYYERREEARRNPWLLLSVIIDGMDQRKCEIPRALWGQMVHLLDALYRAKQTITGALVHHVGRFFFISSNDIKGGATLEIECLHRTIVRTLEFHEQNNKPRPSELCVQMDNCGHQKNKYMLGYLTHLVQKGAFYNITLSFLQKGHTHEDIDQAFSVISGAMKRTACNSPEDFRQQVYGAFVGSPKLEHADGTSKMFTHVEQVEYTHDVAGWIRPHLDPKLKYIQVPHVFQFQKNIVGSAVMHYKAWWRRKVWKPERPCTSEDREDAVLGMQGEMLSEDERDEASFQLPDSIDKEARQRTKDRKAVSRKNNDRKRKRAGGAPWTLNAVQLAAEVAEADRAELDEAEAGLDSEFCERPDRVAKLALPAGSHLFTTIDKEMILDDFLAGHQGPSADSRGISVLKSAITPIEPARHPGRRYFMLAGEHTPDAKRMTKYDKIAGREGCEAANKWLRDLHRDDERMGTTRPHNLWNDIVKSWDVDFIPAWTQAHKDDWNAWKIRRLLPAHQREDPGARSFDVANFPGKLDNPDHSISMHADMPHPFSTDQLRGVGDSEEEEPVEVVGSSQFDGGAIRRARLLVDDRREWQALIREREVAEVAGLDANEFVLLRVNGDAGDLRVSSVNTQEYMDMPVWVAKVVTAWRHTASGESSDNLVRLQFYCCTSGDINKTWFPLLNNSNRRWTSDSDRSSVLCTFDKLNKNGTIPAGTQKQLANYFKGPYQHRSKDKKGGTLDVRAEWTSWDAWDASVAAVQNDEGV